MITIPYPDEFRARLHENAVGWHCTLSGRPRNDAPYWHGIGATPGEAFHDAYNKSLQGFEGEGIRILAAAPTPVRGSADGCIEPKPYDYDGRRMENRNIAALYEIVSRQSTEIHALTERLEGVKEGLFSHRHGVHEGRPVTDGPVINLNAMIAIQGEPVRPAPPQPAADDAGLKLYYSDAGLHLMSVIDNMTGPRDDQPVVSSVSEAFGELLTALPELGLVPRVDPNDPEQVRVVMQEYGFGATEGFAKRILTALASHLAAREAGTE